MYTLIFAYFLFPSKYVVIVMHHLYKCRYIDVHHEAFGLGIGACLQADAPGKPVTHCWVQVFGLPFLPVLQYIAFLNHVRSSF